MSFQSVTYLRPTPAPTHRQWQNESWAEWEWGNFLCNKVEKNKSNFVPALPLHFMQFLMCLNQLNVKIFLEQPPEISWNYNSAWRDFSDLILQYPTVKFQLCTPSLSFKIAQSGVQCMADVRTWSPTGSKYSCQSQNQGIIWLRWVLMSFKHHRSSASLYLVMPLKQWTWPWLCLEYICQISMSDYSCWKTPVCLKNLNSQVKFLPFFCITECLGCP